MIRLEDLRWRHLLHRRIPNLYVQATLSGVTRRTATIKNNTSPIWNEPLTLCVSQVLIVDLLLTYVENAVIAILQSGVSL